VTGYVSPQFHLKFDDFFETVQDTKSLPPSKWQLLSKLINPEAGDPQPPVLPQEILKGVSAPTSRPTAPPQFVDPDLLEFNFVDPDGTENGNTTGVSEDRHIQFDREEPLTPEVPDIERHQHPESTHRSSCHARPPRCLIETAYAVLDKVDAIEDYETQMSAEDPIAFATSKSDPDTLHFGEAMNAADSLDFKKAMLKEVDAHTDHDHWEVWEKSEIPTKQDILPSVWAFKRKRRIDTREVYKYKARLNIHGGMQKHGVNY
jgi:hypothetical protein